MSDDENSDNCVVPTQPLSPGLMDRWYSPDVDLDADSEIARYVVSQTHDETVSTSNVSRPNT
jgi:hypothetical protein